MGSLLEQTTAYLVSWCSGWALKRRKGEGGGGGQNGKASKGFVAYRSGNAAAAPAAIQDGRDEGVQAGQTHAVALCVWCGGVECREC